MTDDNLAQTRAALQRTFQQIGEIVQAMIPPLPPEAPRPEDYRDYLLTPPPPPIITPEDRAVWLGLQFENARLQHEVERLEDELAAMRAEVARLQDDLDRAKHPDSSET
jgi:hypothetical protein